MILKSFLLAQVSRLLAGGFNDTTPALSIQSFFSCTEYTAMSPAIVFRILLILHLIELFRPLI